MKRRAAVLTGVIWWFGGADLAAQEHDHVSPYAGAHEQREIKALSAEDVQRLLAGEGMGFALAAELNGYPGPRHVLDLADSLGLSAVQRREVQAVFDAMQADARGLGRELVEAERTLDAAFAARSVDAEGLRGLTTRIGDLEARLRARHLDAHLATTALLTQAQVHAYQRLRGYAAH